MDPERKRILGIDPGSRAAGYGVVTLDGERTSFVAAGVIRVRPDMPLALRLERLYGGLMEVIALHRPTVSAVEEVFQAVNTRSALTLGHGRGALILAAVHGGLKVYEYSPTRVKQAVVGYGRAEKTQVQHMVSVLLNMPEHPAQDAADALAVAICHAHSSAGKNFLASCRRVG